MAAIDDEAHCLWACGHPDLVEARDNFLANLVPRVSGAPMRTYADFWALAADGCVSVYTLVKFVAICVRVCWSCHRCGGSDVVDIPEVVLNPNDYLDMFDSDSDMSGGLATSSSDEFVEVS
jgi:hypothetical protein